MKIEADNVKDYISKIQEDRIPAFQKLRNILVENLPKGFEETMSYGMIGYVVPHSTYPGGYHCDPKLPLPFINLGSQKKFIGFYHSGIYANKELYDWFVAEYPKHCKYKLDMGKSCVRFKRMDDIPYDLIKELVQKITPKMWIETYENNIKKK